MKKINLTQNKKTSVDEDMFDFLNQWKWCAIKCGNGNKPYFYAARAFQQEKGKPRLIRMHHVVSGYPLNKKEIDHINRNCLDNRRSNLRIIDRRGNASNSKFLNKSSKYTGVSWQKSAKKWSAGIFINGRKNYLGLFEREKDASNCYQNKLSEVNHVI